MYHVSCADNHDSIMQKGLIPGYKPGYEEEKSKYIFLSKKKPSSRLTSYTIMPKNLLEDYLLQMSTYSDTCPKFNLYMIDPEGLDPSKIVETNEKREVAYEGVINPKYISLIRSIDMKVLNERYNVLTSPNWYD